VEATVREIDGEHRLCLGSETCDCPVLIIVSPGADAIAWPDHPQLLHVRRDDRNGSGAEGDRDPVRVHLRRPLLPPGS
jgi:hypothetical protein